MGLEPRPVRRSGEPVYPTKLQAVAAPELLEKHIPLGWLSRKEVAGALSVLLAAGIAGCGGGSTVAPVFHHGEGRGATGCIVMNPPAFLSEEEALQVIQEELAGDGLEFGQFGVEVPSVEIPMRERTFAPRALFRYVYFTDGRRIEEPIVLKDRPPKTLEIDLKDPAKSVAIEFVSEDDYFAVGGARDSSSVQEYDMPEATEYMGAQVREKGSEKMYFGAFYDPMTDLAADSVEESKRLLREQVKDFAEWLKAQGVI